ncbi:MAG: Do family serine endopeptidase, partial [Burkholderiales bacterium]
LPDFTELVEKVGPAVVGIRTTERARAARAGAESDDDMLEFFRRFGIPIPNQRPSPSPNPRMPQQPTPDAEPQTRGVGSGFILSADGYVMTNAHVVDGADEVIVTLTDSREFKAKIIGADKRSDVALVKIEATGLPAVRIGDVAKLKVGEWVIAIGSPFGLESTVTAGIVSAKSRDTGDLVKLIQTDVAINPGNSGGPLINMRGEVVGINSQIYSRSGGYMGISFAIPIDEATRVSDSLRASGRVIRGRIGVAIGPVTKEVAESIGLGKPIGAMVSNVEAGSPAEKAGVEAGDIITKVDGRAVEKSTDLPRMVGSVKPGTKTVLQVFRRGAYRDVSVSVIEFEVDRVASAAGRDAAKPPAAAPGMLGLTVADLTDAQRRDLKVKNGVRIESVEGAAARAGLREGDVLLSIDNTEIASVKQFEATAAKLDKTKAATVLVRRGDVVNFLIIRPAR